MLKVSLKILCMVLASRRKVDTIESANTAIVFVRSFDTGRAICIVAEADVGQV